MLRVGIVANEISGDRLGARLIQALRVRCPDAEFEGVAGEQMAAQGCRSLVPLEQLSVMGLVEILGHLPRLLGIRRRLFRHFRDNPPDLFIGVDAPDFNLGLARRLRRTGIKTVQYVSPTVWAWRAGRIKTLRQSVDLVLSIFPFEQPILESGGVPVRYVGHPLLEQIPPQVDQAAARRALGLAPHGVLIALLPGSRISEIQGLAADFLGAARWCRERRPDLAFVTPLASAPLRACFDEIRERVAPDLPLRLVDGASHQVLAAADLVLTASGTATLEALLHGRPMVVGYRLHPLSYFLAKHLGLVKVPHVAMANLLAGEELAPELIQHACNPEALGRALMGLLEDPGRQEEIRAAYARIQAEMRRAGTSGAAEAVLQLLGKPADD